MKRRSFMYIISPSILSADFANLYRDVKGAVEGGAKFLHIDVMDGRFVPNITIGLPVVKSLRKVFPDVIFDVHLMIVEPERYVEKFIDVGADIVTFHIEATPHIDRTINLIKEKGAKAGIAFTPTTPLEYLNYIKDVDLILIMTVNPGFGGQKFIPTMHKKINNARRIIKEKGWDTYLEVDGGIYPENLREVAKDGANVFVAGNAIFGMGNPYEKVREFLKILGHE